MKGEINVLYCERCGEIFSENEMEIIEEHHPYGNGYATEKWGACPYCNDTDIREAKQCSRCGEYVAETKDDMCDVCYEEMYE